MKARIWNSSLWITETDPVHLKQTFENILQVAGFRNLACLDHHFSPFGYTALWLLAESHLALHTFPEEGRTYVELSSCVEEQYRSFLWAIDNAEGVGFIHRTTQNNSE